MLKLNFKTLFIVLSNKALGDGNISKYSSSIGNILIKCITSDKSFEEEKMLVEVLNLNLNDNVVNYKNKLRKYFVSIIDTDVLYALAYYGVLAKVDELYHIFEKQTYFKNVSGIVTNWYYSKLRDIEGGISIYDAYIYLLTSALLSVIFDEAISKNLSFSKATRLVLSEPIQDFVQRVNEKLIVYKDLC